MRPPSLSIVIPSYNQASLLRQTLESLCAQTLLPDDLEVIASDDGSRDESREVLEEYRRRLPCLSAIYQETNLGGPENWAFLLGRARGDLIFLLSHDDAVAPDFVASHLALFRDDPELDMASSDIELRGPDFQVLAHLPLATAEGPADGPSRCRDQLVSHHMVMSTVYRRSVLLAAGGWDKQVGSHLDCTAYCRAALRARRTYRLARPLLRFRIMPGTWSHRLNSEGRPQLARWYRRKLDLLRDDARQLAPDLLPFLDTMYRWHAKTVLAHLEVELAARRLRGGAARRSIRGLLEVFPEARWDALAWKVWLASYAGTAWLSALRRWSGRPDPYRSPLGLFNSFPGPQPAAS